LDWDEFIQRQTQFLTHREVKVAAVAAREYDKAPSPEVGWARLAGTAGALHLLGLAPSPSSLQLLMPADASL
jgi:hypothetical protein